jgi:hypothetical protein
MPTRGRSRLKKVLIGIAGFIALLAVIGGGWAAYRYHGPVGETPIFNGLVYGCERLPTTAESGGLVHWVRADLNTPGVSIYVTPKDPAAVAAGYEYRLAHTSAQVTGARLAAGVNGTLFDSRSSFIRLPGDLAKSAETAVAGRVANHVDPQTYLLWWDDQKIAHLETEKPPSKAALSKAIWGIGGQQAVMVGGQINPWAGTGTDARTMIAADPPRRLVWIACFDSVSYRFAADYLRQKGATLAIMVDGGTSTAMALGPNAANVRAGTVTGNWRPVATVFGFKAIALKSQ